MALNTNNEGIEIIVVMKEIVQSQRLIDMIEEEMKECLQLCCNHHYDLFSDYQ
jgi:hypothetical protein